MAALIHSYCGPYHLLHRMGESGDCEFYRCEHAESHKERYVAKVLKAKKAQDHDAIERLKREYEALDELEYKGIPHVYRFGTVRDRPCYISELLVGTTDVVRMVKEREEFNYVNMFIAAAKLVAHVHRHDYVHNRIQPKSFLFHPRESRLYLTDFSRVIPQRKEGLLSTLFKRKTKTGAQVRSAADDFTYVAPEVHAGGEPSKRSDCYALGACAYFLLGNERPTAKMKKDRDLSSGRMRAVQRHYEDLDQELVDLIEGCLHPNPDHRPEDGEAVLAVLKDYYYRNN